MDYFEFTFTIEPLMPAREVLIAELDGLGFESFVETDNGLLAYIPEPGVTESEVRNLQGFSIPGCSVGLHSKRIPRQNWNAVWEEGFQPIAVDDAILVHAPFHTHLPKTKHRLVIQPKMSFGTGHHDTTWLMLKSMLTLDMVTKKVLDMGSGTGILGIMALKLGASSVDAIDIDDWAAENAAENARLNNIERMNCETGDAELLHNRTYDVVLANINRNVLMGDMAVYARCLTAGGSILLSGFFTSDQALIEASAADCQLYPEPHAPGESHVRSRNDWCCMRFRTR